MKTLAGMVVAAMLAMPLMTKAQTENPRGIYKLMTLQGKVGEVKAPFDQYKICTDSITLMLALSQQQNGMMAFNVSQPDRETFNYTGPEPRFENDHRTLIYDSNSDHFTEKWWSETKDHMYFPENDWCLEFYESNRYSDAARPVVEALTSVPEVNTANPLVGRWRVIGWMDELTDVKNQLKQLKDAYATGKYNVEFCITSSYLVYSLVTGLTGVLVPNSGSPDKNTLIQNDTRRAVKWLTKDIIAVEIHEDWRRDWQIFERDADSESLMSRAAAHYMNNR